MASTNLPPCSAPTLLDGIYKQKNYINLWPEFEKISQLLEYDKIARWGSYFEANHKKWKMAQTTTTPIPSSLSATCSDNKRLTDFQSTAMFRIEIFTRSFRKAWLPFVLVVGKELCALSYAAGRQAQQL